MNAKTLLGVLTAALLAAGCSHSQPTPDDQQQPPPPPAQQQPPPPPPPMQQQPPPPPPMQQQPQAQQPGVPQHGATGAGMGAMPKGARISQGQAEQTAVAFARNSGMPGAYPKFSEFKNGAWAVTLHGPGPQPGTENKMDVVVGNDGQVHSHALIPYGAPGWNQAK